MANAPRLINKETQEEITLLAPEVNGKVLVQKRQGGLLEVIDAHLLEVLDQQLIEGSEGL